ncbi:MAG: cation:dicarboxylate symporter family transporter, partial [Bacteroidia bacterium]
MKSSNILLGALIGIFSIVAILHQVSGVPAEVLGFGRYAFLALFAYFSYSRNHLTTWVVFSLFMGAEIGVDFPTVAKDLDILGKIFMKLIKSVVAPLLFGTLITGIAGHANLKELGRMGLKTLFYFEVVTTLA